MNDEINTYLSTSLKNWAASQSLPDHGKERLLRQARANYQYDEMEPPLSFLDPLWIFQRKSDISKEWVEKPFIVSRRWSLSIAATWRFVA